MWNVASEICFILCVLTSAVHAQQEWWKPYSPPCTERENVFEFTEKPSVKVVDKDRYEIKFAVKGYCDVTVAIVDPDPAKELVKGRGIVVRHLASGVLGPNAPAPFQKNSLRQTIYWNGKDDLDLYVREPLTMKLRVSLGLKPVFDKRLGGSSPHNLPGYVCGLVVGPQGAVVFSKHWRLHARKYDLDGEYVMSLWPPPANLPEEKLAGMGYVEYEPGRKALQTPTLYDAVSDRGWMFWGVDHGGLGDVQPALYGDQIYFVGFNGPAKGDPAPLYYLKLDGSTDFDGVRGVPFAMTEQRFPRLAASPDGKWLYMTGVGASDQFLADSIVMRRARQGAEMAKPFLGNPRYGGKHRSIGTPGSDNESLNAPVGIDCDAQGRIYVCDQLNDRVQVFSPEGRYLRTIPVPRPLLVRVHQKTGAVYVLHTGREHGRSVDRLTKFQSLDEPREVFHQDGLFAGVFALDSWSARPRLWLAGSRTGGGTGTGGVQGGMEPVTIYEERDGTLHKLLDFDERARKDDGPFYAGRWRNVKGGSGGATRIDCDPLRERAHVHTDLMFDLRTGHYLGRWALAPHRTIAEDLAFDKKGYLHVHFNPGFYLPGVGRVNTARAIAVPERGEDQGAVYYPEAPYDYGVAGEVSARGPYWKGILPVRDQQGAKYFQDGLGVNMKGDVAVQTNIYYVPRLEDSVMNTLNAGAMERKHSMGVESSGGVTYEVFMKGILDRQKRGEDVYFIRRLPGLPLHGATVWTYNATGELRAECAVIAGRLINGVESDEDGKLYFWCNKMRVVGSENLPFLHGRGGTFGGKPVRDNLYPMTGTILKTRGADVRVLRGGAVVPMEPPPARPPDLIDAAYASSSYEKAVWAWAEGAEWLYAGASPITFRGCSCPSPRFCIDWFKRSFVPEVYRHSIGVLDTAGNLVLHIGQYGNFDSGDGPRSRIPVGGDGIGVFHPRAVATTDNYIVFSNKPFALSTI